MATGGMSLSKEFFELLKAIGESKSKQEEDRIIMKEIQRLKSKMEPVPPGATHPLQSKKRAKEFLVRLLYVEMLGHDASFGYIKAVELAASASLYHKRTGYLVCGACLPPTHEFRFMLVNQMQRDLSSSNVLECSGGVLACTALITADMVPAVATEVSKLLAHDSATIRKKSIVCLHRFHQLAPDVVTTQQVSDALRRSLCDKEPSVMGSSLNVLESMIRTAEDGSEMARYKELVNSLVSILKQVGEHRLPSDYEYHRVPAPWIQIKLVRLLGLLGQSDAASSSGMYEVLQVTLQQADSGINAGYAIVYECVQTIVKIYPNTALLDAAAAAISRFMSSRSHNLKYLGVTSLALMVEQHPQYAAQHQLAVLDCLEDKDETLQRKTLDLLYGMTNPVNVEFIVDKFLEFLQRTTDTNLQEVLTTRICSLAEKYAPNNGWYIATITHLMQVSGQWVAPGVAQNLMSLLAEGTGDDSENAEEADMLLRQTAIEIYVEILQQPTVVRQPPILIETMAWCLGEYAYLSATLALTDILQHLCSLAKTLQAQVASTANGGMMGASSEAQSKSRLAVVSAILKLVAQAGTCPPTAAALIHEYTTSSDVRLALLCLEFQNVLTHHPTILPTLFPVDASAEDIQVDPNLSVMNAFVQEAINNGARMYHKPDDDDEDDDDDYYSSAAATGASAFKMTPYEKPTKPSTMIHATGLGSGGSHVPRSSTQGVSLPPGAAGGGGMPAPGMESNLAVAGAGSGLALNTRNVANVWGKGGLSSGAAGAAAAATPAPAAATEPAKPNAAWEQLGSSSISVPSHNPYGSPVPTPTAAAAKSAEQLEKERMAAALFGGVVPGSTAPPPPSASSSLAARFKATRSPAPVAPVAPAAVAAPPVPVAAPPPAPAAPEVDLLDMSNWDTTPTPAPAAEFDTFAPAAPAAPAPAPALVETVDDDDDVLVAPPAAAPPAPAPPPAAAPPPMASADPFAGAGLLGGLEDKPLVGFGASSSSTFEFNGSPMGPLKIVTAQFGQHWGTCSATSPGSVTSSRINTLEDFMNVCQSVGAHPVEAIAATKEGICAGQLQGGSQLALIHAKVTPGGPGATRIDLTVKSTDAALGGSLAMYLQTMLR